MKYLKEYNSFDLLEPIENEEVVEYYQSRSENPKNLEEIVLKSLDSELYDSIQFDFNRHVYSIEDDDFECFQIKLNYRIKGMYYQVVLNTFYTDDEYFICGIERFRSKTGEFNFSGEFFDFYVYRCDSIEGLVELIKNLKF